jgi:hypothetical protein
MVRTTLERLLRPERLDEIFEATRERQYSQELLFSQLVAVMTAVATRTHQSVHAAYLAAQDQLGVSTTALYDKLRRVEPAVTAALIRETAGDAAAVIDDLPRATQTVLPGYEVFYLDGNHPAATQHRLAELRVTREGPLPGQTLALLDTQRELIVELTPGEDAHAQERALLPALLERIRPDSVIIADRNFCTTQFLFGLVQQGAHFIIRQHASTLTYERVTKLRRMGRVETGVVWEQELDLQQGDQTLRVRRITLRLDQPTDSGNTEIHLLTDLPQSKVSAQAAARTYRTRWTIEGVFLTLTDVLRCEVETLGYPGTALFSFAVAVLAWNVYAVVKAALRAAHGSQVIDERLSDCHLIQDVVLTSTGLEIAVDPAVWAAVPSQTPRQFAQRLLSLAQRVNLARYPKTRRGPKKPPPRKRSGKQNHHISTARLLAKSRDN